MVFRILCISRWSLLLAAALQTSLFLPKAALAQNPDVLRSMSAIEAVHFALAHNPEIRAQANAALAQNEDVGVARSYLLPRFSIEERYSLTTNPGYAFFSKLNQERITAQDFDPDTLNHPDRINDFQTAFTVEQPIFVKKSWLGLDMSKREHQARQQELKRKREEIAYQVLKACDRITSTREYARAASQGVEEAQENARVAMLRYDSGLGAYADTLRAHTALSQARQRLNVADKNSRLAQQYLGLLLAMAERVDVSDAALTLPLHALSFYRQSASARSDLGAASLRTENAQANIRLAEAGYWPYLGVGGTYQFNDHDQPFGAEGQSWQVAAFLRWELFDGAQRVSERAKARYLSEQARESLRALQQDIDYRIIEAYANVQEAQANHALAKQALDTAAEGTRLVRLRYANGLVSLAELLSAQAALEEARAGLIDSENAARTAQVILSYESGTLLSDLNIQD